MGYRSATTTNLTSYRASMRQHAPNGVVNRFQELITHFKNKAEGGLVTAPTTPSSQITGSGNTTWNVNISHLLACVDGHFQEVLAAADVAIHSGSKLLDSGQSCIAAIVAKYASATISIVAVKGAAATTGAQVAPTDGEINTGVSSVPWVKLAEITLNRTADTTVTQSQDNCKRPALGINVGTSVDVTA
jgi:hypothetical protein